MIFASGENLTTFPMKIVRPPNHFPEALSDPEESEVPHVLVLVGQQFLEDVVQSLAEALERRPDALLGRRVRGGRGGPGPVEVLR